MWPTQNSNSVRGLMFTRLKEIDIVWYHLNIYIYIYIFIKNISIPWVSPFGHQSKYLFIMAHSQHFALDKFSAWKRLVLYNIIYAHIHVYQPASASPISELGHYDRWYNELDEEKQVVETPAHIIRQDINRMVYDSYTYPDTMSIITFTAPELL